MSSAWPMIWCTIRSVQLFLPKFKLLYSIPDVIYENKVYIPMLDGTNLTCTIY